MVAHPVHFEGAAAEFRVSAHDDARKSNRQKHFGRGLGVILRHTTTLDGDDFVTFVRACVTLEKFGSS